MARKRANGEGKLRQRKDGTWECTLMEGYKPDGRPNMKSFYGKTQAAAKKKKRRKKEKAGILTGERSRSFGGKRVSVPRVGGHVV